MVTWALVFLSSFFLCNWSILSAALTSSPCRYSTSCCSSLTLSVRDFASSSFRLCCYKRKAVHYLWPCYHNNVKVHSISWTVYQRYNNGFLSGSLNDMFLLNCDVHSYYTRNKKFLSICPTVEQYERNLHFDRWIRNYLVTASSILRTSLTIYLLVSKTGSWKNS